MIRRPPRSTLEDGRRQRLLCIRDSFDNPEFISPNAIRHAMRRSKGESYKTRTMQSENLRVKRDKYKGSESELSRANVFA